MMLDDKSLEVSLSSEEEEINAELVKNWHQVYLSTQQNRTYLDA